MNMFFDPVTQMNFATAMSRIAISTTTAAMIGTTSTMSEAFGSVADAYAAKPKRRRTARKKPAPKKVAAPAVRTTSTPAPGFESFFEFATLPMKMTLAAMEPEKEEKVEKHYGPLPAWMMASPFADASKAPTFMPWLAAAPKKETVPTPFTPSPEMLKSFTQPVAMNFAQMPFKQMFDAGVLTERWAVMMGLKRERSAMEKIVDPLDVASNVVEFPKWASGGSNTTNAFKPMIPASFEPAKIAAGLAALYMTPQLLNGTSLFARWPGLTG